MRRADLKLAVNKRRRVDSMATDLEEAAGVIDQEGGVQTKRGHFVCGVSRDGNRAERYRYRIIYYCFYFCDITPHFAQSVDVEIFISPISIYVGCIYNRFVSFFFFI